MKPISLALLVIGLGCAFPVRSEGLAPPRGPSKEADRRNDALVHDGFNLTHGMRLDGCAPGKPMQLVLLFPESGERKLSFWMETSGAEASVRLLSPSGEAEFAWSGSRGETSFTRQFPAGKHTLEISCASGLQGDAMLGIQGEVVSPCALDTARVEEIPASPEAGFRWPYLLFVPTQVRAPQLLVAPNNSGFATEDLELLRASASCELKQQATLATALGVALLMPLFPRPSISEDENLYLHALTRAALTTENAAWKRVDLQLVEMVRDARARLHAKGIDAGGKLLLTGFSASGSFANRFAMLHPEEVLAAVVGSPGGWPIAPVAMLDDDLLPYPVGLGELAKLSVRAPDPAALHAVRWLFFLGGDDENDAVIHRDSFSKADEALIFRRFGNSPAARWKAAESLYAKQELQARFALYPGVAHSISPEMRADVERFFRESIEAARGR